MRNWFDQLLEHARVDGVTDIHLKAGMPAVFRRPGGLQHMEMEPFTHHQLEALADQLLGPEGFQRFLREGEADAAYSPSQGGRVRINCYRERGRLGLAVRMIPHHPPDLEQLGLPPQLEQLARFPDGLVIVAGPTGSGKSTTMASVINKLNRSRALHIVTIEDPIEYVYQNEMSMITQREVGTDTQSFEEALRRVLRQDPDAIVIGEVRDRDTMRTALSAAETGHLVFTTLHTLTARETINRVLELFPYDQQDQVRHVLAGTLRAVVVQRMLPRADGDGRVVAQEILFNTARVQDAIMDHAKTAMLDDIIAESREHHGMQTFNQSLVDLVVEGKISQRTALASSQNVQDLRLLLHQATGSDPLARPTAASQPAPRIQLGQ